MGPTRGKKIVGRKRFVAVDTLGLLWALLVVPASTQDRVGGIALIERLRAVVKRIQVVRVDVEAGVVSAEDQFSI